VSDSFELCGIVGTTETGTAESKYELAFEKPKWRGMTGALISKHRKKPYSFFLAIRDMPKRKSYLNSMIYRQTKSCCDPELQENCGLRKKIDVCKHI